jgi:hypothetical protein
MLFSIISSHFSHLPTLNPYTRYVTKTHPDAHTEAGATQTEYAPFRKIGFSDFIHRPGIKKQTKEKHDISETGSVSVLRCGKKPYSVGSLRKS